MQDEYWLTYAVSAFLENFWYLVVAMFGAVVGSFLGVVIYRLPIIELTDKADLPNGYSLSNPPSYCPHCQHRLESWENVPILGFLWLRGRCSSCHKPIPWRDFAMELLTAVTWVALFHRYNGSDPVAWVNVVLLALFASVLIAAVFIDLDHFIVPDALNRVGVIIGLSRDVIVIGIAWILLKVAVPTDMAVRWSGVKIWQETIAAHTYYGWLPRGFVGAAVYAGLLWTVSFLGFAFYARLPWEPFGATVRRFFTLADPPPPPEGYAESEGEDARVEEDDSPPIRLRFSPGFIVLLTAGLLTFVVGAWSILAFVLPLAAFVALTRVPSESMGQALRRFFRADDLPYEYDAPAQTLAMPVAAQTLVNRVEEPVITGSNVETMVWSDAPKEAAVVAMVSESETSGEPSSFADSQAEADQFAKEAESGAHGGMGLGDVKLAVAIGAVLGPGQAVLSLIFAAFLGAATGLILKAMYRKNTLRLAVPFVPFMAAGAIICLLFGDQIVVWYTNLYAGNPQAIPSLTSKDGPRLLPNGDVLLPSDANFPRRASRPPQ